MNTFFLLDLLAKLAGYIVEASAKDGQEPTYESLRKMAREADARTKPEESHARKAIEIEV